LSGLGTVAYACNCWYLEARDQEDHNLRLAWSKSSQVCNSTNKPGVMVHVYNPNYMGGLGERIVVQAN
jgi:hypothetical protein